MPLIGEFHQMFWRAKAGAPPVVSGAAPWMYPQWQSAVLMASVFGWVPPPRQVVRLVRFLARRIRLLWFIARRLYRWHVWAEQVRPDGWTTRLEKFDVEQMAVLERVIDALDSPEWGAARQLVRQCATTPKFHQPEQWLEYSRALKANVGQAQNVFRHVKVVHELRDHYPVSNPQAHLLTELAYQGHAALGRKGLTT